MPHLAIDDTSIHYERSGVSGAQTLILSTSLGATMEMWEPQRPVFEQHYDLLRYDMRGHGTSSVPPGPYSVAQLAQDVLALVDFLHLNKPVFCGLSVGGAIGQWLAIHAPQKFEAFILANTAAKIGTLDGWRQRIDAVQDGGIAPLADRILQGWLTVQFRQSQPEVAAKMRSMLVACNTAGYLSTCAAVRDADLRDLVHQIHKPVCILAGQHDLSTTMEDAEFLHHAIQGSKLVELPAAHISNVETPLLFTEAVLDFLQGQNFHA